MWKSGGTKYLLPELYCTVRNLEERFFKEAAEELQGIVGNKKIGGNRNVWQIPDYLTAGRLEKGWMQHLLTGR